MDSKPPASATPPSYKAIIFFDGVCNLCNSFIDFLISRDRARLFRYSSLQSDYALSRGIGVHGADPSSIVVEDSQGNILTESNAVLFVMRHLPFPWWTLSWFAFLPIGIRDFGYRMVAKIRYKVFGKTPTCRLPTQEERSLFIE